MAQVSIARLAALPQTIKSRWADGQGAIAALAVSSSMLAASALPPKAATQSHYGRG